ncbi:MAG: DUF1080 domain-containing protein [Planctomycetes bacterium]|nr:DUF1080 domain-containing protein [Planctomycetota bacterium]
MDRPSDVQPSRRSMMGAGLAALAASSLSVRAADETPAPAAAAMEPVTKAFIDGTGEGWRAMGKDDFTKVNSADDTWTFTDEGIHCTGHPISVMRTVKKYTNFELVVQWCHRQFGGNSGIFVWATDESIDRLTQSGKGGLPHGIEVQVLDLGYTEVYTKQYKKPADWFTCHGDVFPVGTKMKPFPPVAPNGTRSFPSKNLTRPMNEWNHYYVRAINGEVRLWVNGEEVSGGTNIEPRSGYLCLESEGAPIDFRNLRIRELP